MKKTSKYLLLLVVFAVVLPLTSGCTKMLADEGRLSVRLEEAASVNYTIRIYPMEAGNVIPGPLEPDNVLTVSSIAEKTIRAGEMSTTFTLNVGNYYVYRTSGGEIGSWRAAQVRRGQDVVVSYSFKDTPH